MLLIFKNKSFSLEAPNKIILENNSQFILETDGGLAFISYPIDMFPNPKVTRAVPFMKNLMYMKLFVASTVFKE